MQAQGISASTDTAAAARATAATLLGLETSANGTLSVLQEMNNSMKQIVSYFGAIQEHLRESFPPSEVDEENSVRAVAEDTADIQQTELEEEPADSEEESDGSVDEEDAAA